MKSLGVISKDKTLFTKEQLIQKLPSKKKTITQEVVDLINQANSAPEFNGDEFIKTMVDYQSAMVDSRASIKEYINALKFCSYLEDEQANGGTITNAYIRARAHDDFVINHKDLPKDSGGYKMLVAAATRYRKTSLVQKILTQADMPLYLMFQGARYKAVAVLAREMESSQHARDRINAADRLLTHVKPPENIQLELDIGVSDNSALEELNMQLAELATKQKRHMELGTMDLKDMGALKPRGEDVEIIEAEVSDG